MKFSNNIKIKLNSFILCSVSTKPLLVGLQSRRLSRHERVRQRVKLRNKTEILFVEQGLGQRKH